MYKFEFNFLYNLREVVLDIIYIIYNHPPSFYKNIDIFYIRMYSHSIFHSRIWAYNRNKTMGERPSQNNNENFNATISRSAPKYVKYGFIILEIAAFLTACMITGKVA